VTERHSDTHTHREAVSHTDVHTCIKKQHHTHMHKEAAIHTERSSDTRSSTSELQSVLIDSSGATLPSIKQHTYTQTDTYVHTYTQGVC